MARQNYAGELEMRISFYARQIIRLTDKLRQDFALQVNLMQWLQYLWNLLNQMLWKEIPDYDPTEDEDFPPTYTDDDLT